KLFDLAFRGSIAHDRLLGWRRALPAGSDEGRTDAVARHPDLWRFADDRMAGLRPALQVEAGGKPHRVDADPVRDPCRDGLGIQPDLHRPRGPAAPWRLHGLHHDRERVLPDHAEPA